MPLTLTLKTGQDFFAGEEGFVVGRIFTAEHFELTRVQDQAAFSITDERQVEIAENVFVSAGEYKQNSVVKIVIEAPREILILRGDNYRVGRNGSGRKVS